MVCFTVLGECQETLGYLRAEGVSLFSQSNPTFFLTQGVPCAGAGRNEVAKIFTVAMEGSDDENCLQHQASCKSIRFILHNECHQNVDLTIHLKHNENYSHTESCFRKTQNISCQCSVTITGEHDRQKPDIIFQPSQEENKTYQGCLDCHFFLLSNQSNVDSLVSDTVNEHKDVKLMLKHLTVSSSILDFSGHVDFSADNVDFVDSQVNVDGLSRMSCSFHCASCSFSMSTKTDESHKQSQVKLSHCIFLSFELNNCSTSNTLIDLSFVCVGNVHMKTLNLFQDEGDNHLAASVHVQQMDAPPVAGQTLPQTILTFENVLSFGKGPLGHSLVVILNDSINSKSEVLVENCTSTQSPGLLNYIVFSNKDSDLRHSVHKLSIINSHIASSDSKDTLIKIQNQAAGIIVFRKCTFINNIVEKTQSIIALWITRVLFELTGTNFVNNTGGVRVVDDTQRNDSHDSAQRNLSSSDFFNEMSLSVSILFESSRSVAQVCNCTFLNSYSEYYAGGFTVQTTLLSLVSVSNRSPFTVQIKDSLFKNVSTIRGTGGAVQIKPGFFSQVWIGSTHSVQRPKLEILVSGCQFVSNSAETGGALLLDSSTKWSFFLVITLCHFERNIAQEGGAIKIYNQCSSLFDSFVEVSFSQFSNNVATGKGSAISTKFVCTFPKGQMKVILSEVDFVDNVVQEKELSDKSGGALIFSAEEPPTTTLISVKQTKWRNNTSSSHGGALAFHLYESSSVHIVQSQFDSNHAGLTGFGGACYFNIIKLGEEGVGKKIKINYCSFANNTASEGGSVFQTSSQALDTEFEILNSVFYCCDIVAADFVAVMTFAHFKNLQFYSVLHKDDLLILGLLLKADGPYLLDNIYFTCHQADITLSVNSFSIFHDVKLNIPVLTSLTASCTKCITKPFTKGNGSMLINQQNENFHSKTQMEYQTTIQLMSPCQPCPFGGECLDGNVKALPNYWGYKMNGQVFFLPCPPQYCCNGIDVPCDSFNTCAPHRTGKLCGKCKHRFSESLMSAACIPDTRCDDWWVWPLGFFLALVYLLWYMYKNSLLNVFKFAILKLHSYYLQKEKICPVGHSGHTEERTKYLTSGGVPKVENAYFDILVYFVNILNIIKVQVELRDSDTVAILHFSEKFFMKYVDVDVQQIFHVDICPFHGVDATSKTLARPVFTLMVLFVWLVLFSSTLVFLKMFSCAKSKTHFSRCTFYQFKLKLVEGFIEIGKYSYSGMASATFLFLTCVGIRNQRVWKYDAEVSCYSTLQKVVVIYAVVYIVPFIFISPLGGKLLRVRAVSYIHIMLACIFPFPFVVCWVFQILFGKAKWGKQLVSTSKHTKHYSCTKTEKMNTLLSKEGKEAQILLDTYQGVYKDKHSHWESVIEIRKLIFCSFYLVPNNMHRLMLCTLASIVVLVHHKSIYPFVHINSNRAETLSLSLLCLACVTNSVKSVFPELGYVVESGTPIEQLLYLMNRLDQIFPLVVISYIITTETYNVMRGLLSKKDT